MRQLSAEPLYLIVFFLLIKIRCPLKPIVFTQYWQRPAFLSRLGPHLVSGLSGCIQIFDPAEDVHQPGLIVFEYKRTRITLLVAAQLVYTPCMSADF